MSERRQPPSAQQGQRLFQEQGVLPAAAGKGGQTNARLTGNVRGAPGQRLRQPRVKSPGRKKGVVRGLRQSGDERAPVDDVVFNVKGRTGDGRGMRFRKSLQFHGRFAVIADGFFFQHDRGQTVEKAF